MDQLALHIEYLLRRNDCIILPGVGAFISVHIPARYDKGTKTWHPMSQEIRFNQAVNQDDGLLANSYARKYSLPFHEARLLLDSDIRSMLNLIDQDGEVSVGRIGTLRQGESKTIIFSPFKSNGLSGKEIGLAPVSIIPVLSDTITEKVEPEKENEIPAEPEYSESTRVFDTTRNYYIAINKTFAKVACSFIIICMVAALVILNADNRAGEDKASVLPVKEIVDTTTSLAKSATRASSEEAMKETEETTNEVFSNVEKEDAAAKRYHLIIGTFKTETEATQYVASSSAQDSEKFTILPSKTLYRVSLVSSDDKSELITLLNSAEVSSRYQGAWIFENKSAF